jgi:hypothetical protein
MQIRFPFASISLFAYLAAMAGCGDDIARMNGTGTGGSGGSSGGSNAGSGGSGGGGSGGTGGSVGGTGGRGGTGGTGGTGGSVGGTGGRGGTGGTGGTGGSVGGTGGRGGTGGTGGTGGSVGGTGGRGGTGGTGGTGGSMAGSGGGGTAGGGTGGGGTGGGGTGGGGTGGGGTGGGGTGGGGTGGTQSCYSVAFVAPTNGATLTVNDDTNNTCADGFQYTVRITTAAPDGTMVQLFNNGNTLLGTATVASGAASFAVQLASLGQSALSIQFPTTAACADPTTRSTVTVNCPASAPTCNISQPTISATHIALNGVLAPAGDRASQPGSPYQVTFVVTTNAEDGQMVTLAYNTTPPGTPTTLTATVANGSATFGVPLSPDGTYSVTATCRNAANVTGMSAATSFPVDTTAPNLTVTSPMPNQFLGPTALDTQGRFNVCGRTTSTDAAGLPASLGLAARNLCVSLNGSPTCIDTAPVTAINTNTCIPVMCPGGAPFDVTVTLKDGAGNPTTTTVQGVSCASTLPSVQIIKPVSDGPTFNDPSRHILAANAPVGVRDLDATTPGAQADVVACTDRNGTAQLLIGVTLTPLGSDVTTVAAVPADGCPSGFGFVARFSGVTLPDSLENTGGTLNTATELRVKVTDALNPASVTTSVPVAVWVDPVAPALSLGMPANLCGSFQQSSTTVTQAVTFSAETSLVTLQVTNGASTRTYMPTSFATGVATFSAVDFNPGQNDVTATEDDPAGNRTTFATVPCTVFIGSAPVVTFSTPTSGQILCAMGSTTAGCVQDADGSSAGWQGPITVHVTGDGQPIVGTNVSFSANAMSIGMATTDSNGNATIGPTGIMLPEGSVTITATTDNIPNRGVGTGTAVVTVDLVPPTAPPDITVTVTDRRRTTMRLDWVAPNDGGSRVAGYEIRYAPFMIDSSNFDSGTTVIPYTNIPPLGGAADTATATPLYIETNYWFALRARDAAGNLGPIVATATPTRADFQTTVLTGGAAADHIGQDVDGSGDFGRPAGLSFTGDNISDLLVGTNGAGRAYLFMGSSTGYAATPTVTFTGAAAGFGQAVANAGDLDGDLLDDIAIAATDDGTGKVFIYSRKSPVPASWGTTNSWPATLTDAQASYVISADGTLTGMSFRSLARLGNFDGQGADDLLVAFRINTAAAGNGVVFVVKGSPTFASVTIPNSSAALRVDGALPGISFGNANIGLGSFLNHGFVSSSSTAGTVFAFAGQTTAGPISAAMNDDSVVGIAADRYGFTLGLLGPLGPSPAAISIGATVGQYVDVHLGTASTGPFTGINGGAPAAAVRFTDSASGNSFGVVNIGGGVKGTAVTASIVGDGSPDLVVGGQAGVNLPLYVIDGAVIPTMSGSVNLATRPPGVGTVSVPGRMPSGWTGYTIGTIIPDSNGDTYADFAVGEFTTSAAGRVVVFH